MPDTSPIWWHVYPLGATGAPVQERQEGDDGHRLLRLVPWLDHVVELGCDGLLLGPVTIEHVWVEVEQDGAWAPLDPVLAFLDRRVNPRRADGGLTAFCRGALVNRLLPLPYERGRPLARHDCPRGGTPVLAVLAHSPRPTAEESW